MKWLWANICAHDTLLGKKHCRVLTSTLDQLSLILFRVPIFMFMDGGIGDNKLAILDVKNISGRNPNK
jgi:hypothetical protein